MNIDDDNHIKSSRLEEVDIPQNLDLLNKWTIPKVDTKLIYNYGWFDKLSTKQVVKTIEQSLALNSDEQTIQLLNNRDIDLNRSRYNWMHIGMVQIAFKPLTLKGLPETFLAALRDARNPVKNCYLFILRDESQTRVKIPYEIPCSCKDTIQPKFKMKLLT